MTNIRYGSELRIQIAFQIQIQIQMAWKALCPKIGTVLFILSDQPSQSPPSAQTRSHSSLSNCVIFYFSISVTYEIFNMPSPNPFWVPFTGEFVFFVPWPHFCVFCIPIGLCSIEPECYTLGDDMCFSSECVHFISFEETMYEVSSKPTKCRFAV